MGQSKSARIGPYDGSTPRHRPMMDMLLKFGRGADFSKWEFLEMRFAGNLGHSFQILVDFRDLEVGACRATKSSTSVTNKQTFQLRINKMVDCYFHKCMCLL